MTVANLTRETVSKFSTTEGLYWDATLKGFGYFVRKDSSGTLRQSYLIQYRANGVQRKQKLGSAPPLTVDNARKMAMRLLGQVLDGKDPAAEKEAKKVESALTFEKAVDQYLRIKQDEVREGRLRPATLKVSTLYLTGAKYFPNLHRLPLARITQSAIAERLDAIHLDSGMVTASRARAHLSAFFTWSMRRGHAPSNPVALTEKLKKAPSRDRVLSDSELATLWKACDADTINNGQFGKIIKLLVLTGCRRSEIGGLKWSEIDSQSLTIPAERSKNHRAHIISLTDQMRAVVESVPHMLSRDHLFGLRANGFNSWQRQPINDCLEKAWKIHDIRRTVATGMINLGIQPHIVEAVLNHAGGHKAGVAGIYNRATYDREMRNALKRWGEHVASIVSGKTKSNVVSLLRA
jgi:integrase